MKRIPAFFHLAALVGCLLGTQTAFGLSKAEADAIVEAEAAAQAVREAEERDRLEQVPAIQKRAVVHARGRTVIRRVAPPSGVQPRTDVQEPSREPEVEDRASPQEIDSRPEKSLTLTITVAEGASVIRSRLEGVDYVVFCEDDLSYLPPFVTVETPETRYAFFSFVFRSNPSNAEEAETPPIGNILPADEPGREEFMVAIEVLREHYLENRERYEAETRRAEALQAARERRLTRHPPQPGETVINVWRQVNDHTEAPEEP